MSLISLNKNSYTNKAGTIILPCPIIYSDSALDVYAELNVEVFNNTLYPLKMFDTALKCIELKHSQKCNHIFTDTPLMRLQHFKEVKGNKVLLAFSGGLDSTYQAIWLREQGYEVTLFHVKNMNYYTNGKEFQVVNDFSNRFSFPLQIAEFKQNNKGEYKKFWKENSFKNTLLYTMMVDYCIANNIRYISSGDDLRLNLSDTVTGTNVGDAWEVTTAFFKNLQEYNNIEFLGINGTQAHLSTDNIHKGIRLKKLQELNGFDYFYSCVNPGRFNQSNHNRIEKKFNVKLEKWNCGVCRKCAYHSLLRHYYLNEYFPQEFIDFCWEKIGNGADYEFFKPSLPLETRINNLFDY